jgi:hypothetical protein
MSSERNLTCNVQKERILNPLIYRASGWILNEGLRVSVLEKHALPM